MALILVVFTPSLSAASDQRNRDSLSWSTVPRGVAFTAGVVGVATMIVSGVVIADGLQEDCKKGFQDEVTCDPDEEQVVSGMRWMGAGAILLVAGAAVYGTVELVEWASRSAARSEAPKEIPLRRTEEDVGNPIPVAP